MPRLKTRRLRESPLKRVEALGLPICLVRLADGEIFALSDTCSHEEIELSDGDLDGEDVECPAHGSRFNARTGEVSGLPAVEPVATYPVSIDDGWIVVEG
jgi:3-phenylpropionate/trans-cinnamate dioxygenase ferredoxin subunit